MGIQGLLPLLKSTMLPIHIKDLQGCSVAIDTYSWLHKGALSCSTQLCKGLPTSSHIEYCMHRVNLLRHYGVKPVLVFDGGFLPMKLEQENKRARSRKENLARAIEHESNGNSTAAYECYQKAVDISPSIAHDLIQVLKQENVSYVVAPYEADAQMTFMAVNKHVDAVITEDSDLIAFGCPRIIFKMDKYGQGVEFQYSRLHKNKELCFAGFTNQMVLEMCILSGCDYLQSLPGMGLKRAHALISKFKSYEKKALLTFKHQRVYDPTAEDIVHLSDIPESLAEDVAKGIATGDVDPFTQMPFQVFYLSLLLFTVGVNKAPVQLTFPLSKYVFHQQECTPSSAAVINGTSKAKNSKPQSIVKKIDLPVQKNLLTNYFCIHTTPYLKVLIFIRLFMLR
ncbi:Exonuclease 1 [Linum perenne]